MIASWRGRSDPMLAFLVFLMAVYGLSNAVAVLKFGAWIRTLTAGIPFLGSMIRCPTCLAFWVGMLISWKVMSPSLPFCAVKWMAVVMDGLAASAFAYIVHVSMEKTGHGLDI